MSVYAPISQSLSIEGKSCWLVPDEVATVSQLGDDSILVKAETKAHDFIWCREADVSEARGSGPNVQVYGAWQVALHNGWINKDKRLHLIYQRDGGGLYGIVDKGRLIETGPFEGNQILATVEVPPIDQGVDITDEFFGVIKAPGDVIETPVEREAKRASQGKMMMIGGGVMIASIIAAAAGADVWLASKAEGFQRDATAQIAMASAINDELSVRRSQVSPITDVQRVRWKTGVERIAEVVSDTDRGLIEGNFEVQQWRAEVGRLPTTLTFPVAATSYPGTAVVFQFSLWDIPEDEQ